GSARTTRGKMTIQSIPCILQRWDSATGKIVWQKEGAPGFYIFATSPDGKWLAASDHDQLQLLDPETGKPGAVLIKWSFWVPKSSAGLLLAPAVSLAPLVSTLGGRGEHVQPCPRVQVELEPEGEENRGGL